LWSWDWAGIQDETMTKQIPVKIDADIVKWFDKEAKHDINTILKGHIKIVEVQRKVASIPDSWEIQQTQYFRPMLKQGKKKGKGKVKK